MFLGYQLHPFRTEVYFSRSMGCQLRERDEVTETLDGCSELTQLVAFGRFYSITCSHSDIFQVIHIYFLCLKGNLEKYFQHHCH
jgi:hypothetical protein